MAMTYRFSVYTDEYHNINNILTDHSVNIEFDGENATLKDMLHQLEYFLKAAGYEFDGNLEIVNEEKTTSKEKICTCAVRT